MVGQWDQLEADFRRFYRLDLRECLWGREWLGCRRLWALMAALPAESAFQRALAAQPRATPAPNGDNGARAVFKRMLGIGR